MTTLISLTESGAVLAKKIQQIFPDYHHLANPKPFAKTVQQLFREGQRLILICATGIAVRTLAPVLASKLSDPAVLVLDDKSQFVIPLLSGHEGGANEWGRQISQAINAQLVITSAQTYLNPVYVAGMGCERHCPVEVLKGLLIETVQQANLTVDDISALSSIDVKADEVGLMALAEQLNIPFVTYNAATLRSVEDQLTQKSDIVFREVGCYGVAEAAALIAANAPNQQPAELLIPKQKNKQATCAIARSYANET